MDTLTHAVIGVLAIRVPRAEYSADSGLSEGWRVAAVAAGSVFPDLDYASFLVDPYRFITEWHRGVTHSLLLLPLWAVLLGLLFSAAIGRFALRWELVRLCGLGLLLHSVFDLITVYGTQVFSPLSDYRIAFGLTFDADIWIAAIAAVSLILSFSRRVFARLGMVLVGFYLAMALMTQMAAIRIGDSRHSPSPQNIYAIAHPLSIFHRILVIETSSGYWHSRLDLSELGRRFLAVDPLDRSGLGRYQKEDTLRWKWQLKPGISIAGREVVHDAWRQPAMTRFRRFAVLPVLYRIDRDPSTVCVWFTDLRYVIPRIIPPFRYGMCRKDPDSDWQSYRLKRFTQAERELVK